MIKVISININKYLRNLLLLLPVSGILILTSTTAFAESKAPSISHYDVIESRNFFRPAETLGDDVPTKTIEAPTKEKTTNTLEDLVLTGIIKIRGHYKAIIERKSEQKGFYVSVDEIIDGYHVTDISSRKVTLEKDGSTYTLVIKGNKAKATPSKSSSVSDNHTENLVSQTLNINYHSNPSQSIRMGLPQVQNVQN